MTRNIPTTNEEHGSAVERLLEQGRQEGRQQGRQEGRQALLRLAERRLGAEVARELAAIDDLDRLEERLFELLGPTQTR